LHQKDKIIEENERSLIYYAEKYIKETEERGKAENAKIESGSEASKPQLIDLTELDMEHLTKKHELERLEFYERYNSYLLDKLSTKQIELDEFRTSIR